LRSQRVEKATSTCTVPPPCSRTLGIPFGRLSPSSGA
jgi:hypothetical protein